MIYIELPPPAKPAPTPSAKPKPSTAKKTPAAKPPQMKSICKKPKLIPPTAASSQPHNHHYKERPQSSSPPPAHSSHGPPPPPPPMSPTSLWVQQQHLDDAQQQHFNDAQQQHLDDAQQQHFNDAQQQHLDDAQQQHFNDAQQQHLDDAQQQHLNDAQQQHPLSPLPDFNPDIIMPPALVEYSPQQPASAFAPYPLYTPPTLPHAPPPPPSPILSQSFTLVPLSQSHQYQYYRQQQQSFILPPIIPLIDGAVRELYATIEALARANKPPSAFKPPLFFYDSPHYATLFHEADQRGQLSFVPSCPPRYSLPCTLPLANPYKLTLKYYLQHHVRLLRAAHDLSTENKTYISTPDKIQDTVQFKNNLNIIEHLIPDLPEFFLTPRFVNNPAASGRNNYVFDRDALLKTEVAKALANFRARAARLTFTLPPAQHTPIDCAFDALDPRSVVVTLQAFVDRTTQSVNILHPNNVFDNFIMVARIFALILFYSKISDADFRRWVQPNTPAGAPINRFNELIKAETDYVRASFRVRTFNSCVYDGYHADPIQTVLNGFPRPNCDTVESPDDPNTTLAPLQFCIWTGPNPAPAYWPKDRIMYGPYLPPAGSWIHFTSAANSTNAMPTPLPRIESLL